MDRTTFRAGSPKASNKSHIAPSIQGSTEAESYNRVRPRKVPGERSVLRPCLRHPIHPFPPYHRDLLRSPLLLRSRLFLRWPGRPPSPIVRPRRRPPRKARPPTPDSCARGRLNCYRSPGSTRRARLRPPREKPESARARRTRYHDPKTRAPEIRENRASGGSCLTIARLGYNIHQWIP